MPRGVALRCVRGRGWSTCDPPTHTTDSTPQTPQQPPTKQDVIDAAARFRDSQVYATSIAGHINPTPGPLALTATEPTAASSQDDSQPAPQSPSSPTSSNASAASSTITAPTAGGATAAAITGKISGSKTGAIYDGLAQWVWQFRVLLGRTAHNYVRNPGNVLVRIAVMALLALLQGGCGRPGVVWWGYVTLKGVLGVTCLAKTPDEPITYDLPAPKKILQASCTTASRSTRRTRSRTAAASLPRRASWVRPVLVAC